MGNLLNYPFYEPLDRIHEARTVAFRVLFCISEPLCTDEEKGMKRFKSSYHDLLVKSVKYMKSMLWSGEV